MKKLLTVVSAVLLGLAVVAPAQAATERIYFEGYKYIVGEIDPGDDTDIVSGRLT